MEKQPKVWIIDDDQDLRNSVVWLLQTADIQAVAYESPDAFFEAYDPEQPGCLLVDLMLSETSGLELLEEVRERGGEHPFIMISGKADVATAVESLRRGAVDFLEKPFEKETLVALVRKALEEDKAHRVRKVKQQDVQQRLESLTAREREVMQFVVQGMLTKQIARQLNISEKTVEVHRSHITKKMQVASVAQLVRLVTEHLLTTNGKNGLDAVPAKKS